MNHFTLFDRVGKVICYLVAVLIVFVAGVQVQMHRQTPHVVTYIVRYRTLPPGYACNDPKRYWMPMDGSEMSDIICSKLIHGPVVQKTPDPNAPIQIQ